MKRKYKGFMVVSVLIVLSDIIFIFMNYQAAIETLNDDVGDWAAQTEKVFKIELNSKATSMQQLAAFVANDPRVSRLFKEGKEALLLEGGGNENEKSAAYRKQLLELLLPSWKKMTAMYDVRQLHFHLGPGSTSFLRVHRPEKFGDNMDEVRHTVVDVNTTAQPTSGFETGRVYSGIRGVVPVFHTNEGSGDVQFVGALEAGTSFSVLLESMRLGIGCDVCILLNKEHVEENMWPAFMESHFEPDRRVGPFFIEASTHSEVKNILANKAIASLLSSGGTTIIGKNNPIQASVFPLRDYQGTLYPHLPDSGSVFIWKDATKRWELFQRTFLNNIAYSILALLVVETMLFLVWKYSREKLQAIIDQKTHEISQNYARVETIMDKLPTGILVADTISRAIISVNPQAAMMIGDSPERIIGRSYSDLFDEPSEIKRNPTNRGPFECLLLKVDGCPSPILKTEIITTLAGREIWIVSFSDLTKHKEAETERRHREKLEGVLELAGAVCHEMNQPLMAISGFAELLAMDCDGSDRRSKNVVRIQALVDRIATITWKLMNITRYETKSYLDGKIIDLDSAAKGQVK